MMDRSWDERMMGWQRRLLLAAAVGVPLCAALALYDLDLFLETYLLSFLFWWVIAVGCLGLILLHHLVGGAWGDLLRPYLRAGAATMPLVLVMSLIVVVGANRLYPWADSASFAERFPRGFKATYLHPLFVLGRAVLYFAVWLGLAGMLSCLPRRWLYRAAPEPTFDNPLHAGRFSCAIGFAVLILTVSFAAIDWAMSLEPQWHSAIFGALIAVGGALAALALATAVAASTERTLHRAGGATSDAYADVGSLLMALVMLWAYFGFSQYLIIWAGNLPEEAFWYVPRVSGAAGGLALAIVVFHFVVPFTLLLSRELKRNPKTLGTVGWLILATHYVYLYWTIVPSFGRGLRPGWDDLVVPIGIACAWLAVFLGNVRVYVAHDGTIAAPESPASAHAIH